MSNSAQNPQQRQRKRERSRDTETEVATVEQNEHARRLKRAKPTKKDDPVSAASTEKSVPSKQTEAPTDASPVQESAMTNDELLRKMMEDDDDDEFEAPRPNERRLRKAKHVIREQIDVATKAKREMGKAVADFDKYFAQLERAHVYATTRDALVTSIECVPRSISRILSCTSRMKTELETLQEGIDDDGEMAHLLNAIIEIEMMAEKIGTHHSVMTKEVKMATNAKKPKGPKGFDDIQRLNNTMQGFFKEFPTAWKAVLRFTDLIGAERDAEFEIVESEHEDDED